MARPNSREPFVLGLNTSTIKNADLMTKIRVTAEAGFAAIELWNDELTAYEQAGGSITDVAKALGGYGLQVPTVVHIGGWMDSQGQAYRQALEEARRKMAQAAGVGAERIIAGPGRGAVDIELAAERYRELMEIGREEGVLPAVEFLGFVAEVNTIAAAWEIVSKSGVPDGAVVLDSFHIFRGGSDPSDINLIPAGSIAVFHLNDAPGDKPREEQTDAHRVLPGEGVLPLVQELRLLQQKGYQGVVSLELFNPALWEQDPGEVAKLGMRKVQALMEQL